MANFISILRMVPRRIAAGTLFFIVGFAPLFATGTAETGPVVNVYSHRHYDADRQLYAAFTEETGIAVNVVEAGADELIQRLASEGENSPADLLVTVDAGRLYRAKEMGLLQAVESPALERLVPQNLRDPEGFWYGITVRARGVVYAPDRVTDLPEAYEDLADPEWKGRIAVRSSTNIYNVSLGASLVAHGGPEAAAEWASGVVGNMARRPQGNDRDQIRAVAAGQADLAIVNSYYLGLLASSSDPADREVAEAVAITFPRHQPPGTGTHINVSGAGVTASAPNPENARRLLEFLLSDKGQALYAEANYEYPVREGLPLAPEVAAWPAFEADSLNLSALGEYADEATETFDAAGWE
jgi:iron(III) transport system substrate-binding protein